MERKTGASLGILNYISLTKKKKMSRVVVLTYVGKREHSIHIRVTGEIFQNMQTSTCCYVNKNGKEDGRVGESTFF